MGFWAGVLIGGAGGVAAALVIASIYAVIFGDK